MGLFESVISYLPEVSRPTQRRLSFKEKLKWTAICLVIFYALGLVPLFGLGQNALQQFEYLSIILGAQFGSLISLGIGPLVTASIVLQLLNGSGLVKFDQKIDTKYVSITRQLMTYMAQDPKSIPDILNILWAARAMERMGDRCENIAEYIFYLVHGKDIRHTSLDDVVEEMLAEQD